MTKKSQEIEKYLAHLSADHTILDMLLEVERTLDNAGIYAYENWEKGELVAGPDIEKYWITTTWMYPYKEMPNPKGGLRLVRYGCKIWFKIDTLMVPKKIKGPQSYADSKTKSAKLNEDPIWLVIIKIPRRFIDDGLDMFITSDKVEKDLSNSVQGEMNEQPLPGEQPMTQLNNPADVSQIPQSPQNPSPTEQGGLNV